MLAEVFSELPSGENLLARATRTLELAVEAEPENAIRSFGLFSMRVAKAVQLERRGLPHEARQEYEEAIPLGEQAVALEPDNAQLLQPLLVAYNNYGFLVHQDHRTSEAKQWIDKAEPLARALFVDAPNDPRIARHLSNILWRRAEFAMEEDDWAKEDEALREILQVVDEVLGARPDEFTMLETSSAFGVPGSTTPCPR